MNTRRALAIISSTALLCGVLAAYAASALEKIRPPVDAGLFWLVVMCIGAVSPGAIVYVVWRRTTELRFTGVLVAVAAVLLSLLTAFFLAVAGCLFSGRCM